MFLSQAVKHERGTNCGFINFQDNIQQNCNVNSRLFPIKFGAANSFIRRIKAIINISIYIYIYKCFGYVSNIRESVVLLSLISMFCFRLCSTFIQQVN